MSTKKDLPGKYKNLKVFNFIMGFFHFIQGTLMLLLSNKFSLPITTSYLSFDIANKTTASAIKNVGSVQIGPVVSIFLFLSAGAHFLLTLPKVYDWYINYLKKGINLIRWYEYTFSSSIMIVIIAMLCGMYDLSSLILIFTVNASMIFFGLLMELHNQTTKKTDWTSFIFGSIVGFIPWVVIAMYFVGAVSSVGDIIPKFVYGILVSLFVFFNIFPLNMYLQYKKLGKWKDYLFGEKVYILLSLIAKSALAWQVFSGTLRP